MLELKLIHVSKMDIKSRCSLFLTYYWCAGRRPFEDLYVHVAQLDAVRYQTNGPTEVPDWYWIGNKTIPEPTFSSSTTPHDVTKYAKTHKLVILTH